MEHTEDSGVDEPATTEGRVGMVAVVGRANVGKSTLVNHLLGEKVSIVSGVAQTTRNLIRGILTESWGQIAFLDTPGVHKAEHDLGRVMNRSARKSIDGADVVLLILDGGAVPRDEDAGWMRKLLGQDQPIVIVQNKTDAAKDFGDHYRKLWADLGEAVPEHPDPPWLKVSAKTGEGCDLILAQLIPMLPEGPLLFPEETLSDFPRDLHIADVIREKLFQNLRDEVPHSVAVQVNGIEETEEAWKVEAVIYVERPSQKAIVIGHKARELRKIRRQAEIELSDAYSTRVRLNLWIKVEKHWARNHWILKNLGYQ